MNCAICKTEFHPSPKQARNIRLGGRPFCSRACSNKGRIKIVTDAAATRRQKVLESRIKNDAVRETEAARQEGVVKTLNSVLLTFGRRA